MGICNYHGRKRFWSQSSLTEYLLRNTLWVYTTSDQIEAMVGHNHNLKGICNEYEDTKNFYEMWMTTI
jgi:hypothetical protein